MASVSSLKIPVRMGFDCCCPHLQFPSSHFRASDTSWFLFWRQHGYMNVYFLHPQLLNIICFKIFLTLEVYNLSSGRDLMDLAGLKNLLKVIGLLNGEISIFINTYLKSSSCTKYVLMCRMWIRKAQLRIISFFLLTFAHLFLLYNCSCGQMQQLNVLRFYKSL